MFSIQIIALHLVANEIILLPYSLYYYYVAKVHKKENYQNLRLIKVEISALTVIAFVVASPFAWLAMSRWLQTYQYRIHIGLWIFVAVLAVIWLLAMFTLLVQGVQGGKEKSGGVVEI
jgi:hypothetical protein